MATQPSGNLGRMDPIASVRYCKRWFTEERAGWLENRDVVIAARLEPAGTSRDPTHSSSSYVVFC